MEIIGFTRVFRLDPPEQKYLDPPLKFLSKDDKTLKRLWLTKWAVTTATECLSTISKISELSQMYSVLLTHQSTYGRTTLHLRVVNDLLISRLALTTNVMFF